MRFAADADTATFIAATETVLEPGDVLSVVAPATLDAALAKLGFTLFGIHVVCPPVLQYSPQFQALAAEELVLLPEGSAVTEMITDYAVMREQARACQ